MKTNNEWNIEIISDMLREKIEINCNTCEFNGSSFKRCKLCNKEINGWELSPFLAKNIAKQIINFIENK